MLLLNLVTLFKNVYLLCYLNVVIHNVQFPSEVWLSCMNSSLMPYHFKLKLVLVANSTQQYFFHILSSLISFIEMFNLHT